MSLCNRIRNLIKMILSKCIIFPVAILAAPLFLIILGHDCASAWEEYKEFIGDLWRDDL